MPTVDLLSNGEKITILYDVLGAGATCSREDQADSQQQENPKHNDTIPPDQPQQIPEAGRKPQTAVCNPGGGRGCTGATIEAAPPMAASGPPAAVPGCRQAVKEEQPAADALESDSSQTASSVPPQHSSDPKKLAPCHTRLGSSEPQLTPSISDSAHEQMPSEQACNEVPISR